MNKKNELTSELFRETVLVWYEIWGEIPGNEVCRVLWKKARVDAMRILEKSND